ncbi:MAG: hypothetical protein BZY73_05205 [SAR202 cluster bacterium Casp-Chloro-G3]|nr:hypothetical protein [Chloroflexota bacterium]PKB57039.1 MAG: hypothetical protein BZY73_05205 [SAR202 cluster bacterium Casp-Chloro-G3]
MPDAMLVALVGIIVAAVSGSLGAGITGYITYKTTNRQVQARLNEVNQQFRQQSEEGRRSRLIEARKSYLFPLRSGISDCYGAGSTLLSNTRLIQALKGGGLPTDSMQLRDVNAQIDAAGKTFTNSNQVIGPLIGQIADPKLLELVSSYYWNLGALTNQITMMLITVQTGAGADNLESLIVEIDESIRRTIPEMLAVNRRIEELLSGD